MRRDMELVRKLLIEIGDGFYFVKRRYYALRIELCNYVNGKGVVNCTTNVSFL